MSVDPLRDRLCHESANLAASTTPAMQATGTNILSTAAANSARAHAQAYFERFRLHSIDESSPAPWQGAVLEIAVLSPQRSVDPS